MMRNIFLLLLLVSSCSKKKADPLEVRIAKTLPAGYINTGNNELTKRNDTFYIQNKFFSGYRYSLFPNADTEIVQGYFNGVEEGEQKKWYENGQIAEQRFYINGKKQGLQKGWWPDGKLKFEFIANNDEYDGEFKEWYASGLLGKQFHYVNGKEEGSQKLWWDNGTIRANYVIKKGKKYGLIGLKTCINPYDSVIRK